MEVLRLVSHKHSPDVRRDWTGKCEESREITLVVLSYKAHSISMLVLRIPGDIEVEVFENREDRIDSLR
jgi:hypothetical protein